MKRNCLKEGQYKDPKAKDKFNMLCHLEDFEIQYYNLLEENSKIIKMNLNKHKYASETEGKYILEKTKLDQLKKWLNEDYFNYRTGWFTQDMETTYRVDEHIKTIKKVIAKIEELEGNNDGDIYRNNP